MKTTTNVMIALLAMVSLSGCASIVSKSIYPVNISSQPDGADVTVVNKSGQTVFRGKTPTVVSLKAGAGYFQGQDYTVTFEKAGHVSYKAQIKRGIDMWYVGGNFVFGGLIGWLIVDPATGAMWTLDENVHADLSPLLSSANHDEGLHVVSLDNVPDRFKRHMVRMN
jgi:hypothetical protein